MSTVLQITSQNLHRETAGVHCDAVDAEVAQSLEKRKKPKQTNNKKKQLQVGAGASKGPVLTSKVLGKAKGTSNLIPLVVGRDASSAGAI